MSNKFANFISYSKVKYSVMKKPILTLLSIIIISFSFAQKYSVTSPDNNLIANISFDNYITFHVMYKGEIVIEESLIDMVVSPGPIFSDSPIIEKVNKKHVDEEIHPVIKQKSAIIHDNYNEITINTNHYFGLTFRAYNDGIAYRFFGSFQDSISIVDEQFNITFPYGATALFPKENSMVSHYERMYVPVKPDTLNHKDFCSLPLYVKSGKTSIIITESDLYDYPGMFLCGTESSGFKAKFPNRVIKAEARNGSDRNQILRSSSSTMAYTKGSRTFPWRIMIMSDEDKKLVESNLVFQLARPLEIDDPSWIVPGKVAWDWYNANNIYGVDFESGINTDTYKYYIDFASEYGLEYIILDEGWSKSTTIIDKPNPDINIEELVSYGKKKNVGLILWVLWEPLDSNMEVLALYHDWGIKGVKVDFMQRTDQYMVNYYERVAQEAAKNKLLVDFHGAYKPSGLRRAYPNVLTYEGLKGAENNKWSSLITPEHNVTLPFIRMVAGPMDYTPGAMNNANEKNHQVIWTRPISIGTRCHQVAMYVVYESPLQMLCESPSAYYNEKETTEFISKIPTTWDETIAIDGKVGEYIIVARRNGDNWYIGGMTNSESRNLTIDLSFLEKAEYKLILMKDGKNVDKFAQDFNINNLPVNNSSNLKIKLAAGGGFAAILSKK